MKIRKVIIELVIRYHYIMHGSWHSLPHAIGMNENATKYQSGESLSLMGDGVNGGFKDPTMLE